MMEEKFKKLLEKKGSAKLSKPEMEAKKSVLEELKKMISSSMGEKLHGLKKVTVASDSEEGLEKGLEKAQELVEKGPMALSEESEEESEESSEEYAEESEEAPAEEDEISQLEKKLAELKAKKSLKV